MRTLYFDCFAGASGNMILAALVSLGLDREELLGRLKQLEASNFHIEFTQVDRSGLSALHAEVVIPEEKKHRHLSDIEKIIDGSSLSNGVKFRAKAVFRRLADAEASVHGIDIEKVHFHEVGALDAIVDVVGACIAFEMLGIERFACSSVHVGSGFIEMAHGKFPVPPPAVAHLLKGIPIYSNEIRGELTTPTGAAIISTVCDSYGPIPEILVEAVGYGAGSREYAGFPNVLRVLLGETSAAGTVRGGETLSLLESNIDDLSPQVLGYVMERAFELGALDCWFTPIQMKKNRPAVMLSILSAPAQVEGICEMIYLETTTIGIRIRDTQRDCLERAAVRVKTAFGPIDVKVARRNGMIMNVMPEYEQVKLAAMAAGVSFRSVSDAAIAAFNKGSTADAATA